MANRHGSEDGFTIVEVLVAAVLLIIGLLATLALLENGIGTTAVTKQKDVGNALAQEMIERATGGQNSVSAATPKVYVNDLVDYRVAATKVGPADRLRAQMDPDGDQSSTAVTPATPTDGTVRKAPQTWTVQRKGTTYTVSYYACTLSDTVGGVYVATDYDCGTQGPCTANCSATSGGGGQTACAVTANGYTNATTSSPILQLHVAGLNGLNLCAGNLAGNIGVALCNAVGGGSLSSITSTLANSTGSITANVGRLLAGGINSAATLSFCSPSDVTAGSNSFDNAIGSSTRVSVSVAWKDQRGQPHTISQSTLVRRQATT